MIPKIPRAEKRKIIERIYARDTGVTVENEMIFLRHNKEIFRGYLPWVFTERIKR